MSTEYILLDLLSAVFALYAHGWLPGCITNAGGTQTHLLQVLLFLDAHLNWKTFRRTDIKYPPFGHRSSMFVAEKVKLVK